eukprot:GFUD01004774.1.p1 GENE.GFUD01004774.1~~GFUD01004774.1.p1  ORF type:complete len:566 (+),score=118.87 GFUD01004774.1:136-1833(+)
MEKRTLSLVTVLLLVAAVQAEEEKNITLPKPFGIGIGPAYIGGRDTDEEGTELSLKIYQQYIMFKRLSSMNLQEDEQYYSRWTGKGECIGACPQYSHCKKGICVCKPEDSRIQVYGRCFSNSTAYFVGDKEKYRKPTPPARPEWCFCEKKNGGKDVCPENRGREECQVVTYPNNFDHNTQYCLGGDHSHCLGKDINMFCSSNQVQDQTTGQVKNLCQCRKDMKFDTKNMECRIRIDVDCTYENKEKEGDLTWILKGRDEPKKEYTLAEIKTAFCNLIDAESAEYNAHIVGEFTFSILGLSIGGFIAVCCITCVTACCCCKCCEKVKAKIRALDPRNAMRDAGMGPGTQMAALGAVAAGEYMENRNDKQDEARVAAMQGQSMGMPGGAPPGYAPVPEGYPDQGAGYPQDQRGGYGGQEGYAPVPTGYPPAGYPQPGYPQPGYEQPGYPQPGYPQPGYPQPGYPQGGYPPQGQPGYIPPADGGPGIMNMAPELALAGAGAFTGNAAMAGLGVVAAAEKMGAEEDKEDRFRAAVMKGVPPPPMGYAGGAQPSYPQNQPPYAEANYPRQ